VRSYIYSCFLSVQVQLTLALAAVAVPINTLFGISAALLIARNNFPGKTVLLAILDLPFSISPVVTGLMLVCCHFSAASSSDAVRDRQPCPGCFVALLAPRNDCRQAPRPILQCKPCFVPPMPADPQSRIA
jgi:hypothetical protein